MIHSPALLLGAVLLLALPSPGSGQMPMAQASTAPRTIEAVRLEPGERIRLDGTLDEAVWQRALPAGDFLQQEPREGTPSTERTEVRVLYDDDHLYIGAMLYDSNPGGVIGRQRQRDAGLGSDDRFMWILDTFLDGRSGYFFEINPAGLMGDGLLRSSTGGGVNKSWDGIWEARVAQGAHGWSAEIRIPFRTLNFDPLSDSWGINFQRTVRRKSEETLWSGHRRNQGLSRPSNAGRLTGLRGISQGIGVEAKPYVVASAESMPLNGLPRTSEADVGLDINYSLTPGLRASVTVNTDFAEAEVDQRRVNLTRFPLVFPERRDFFLEGSSVFEFAQSSGAAPYFSRRIGMNSIGRNEGNPVPIRAGARLVGQAGAYEMGLLHVRTGVGDLGNLRESPGEEFTVARVRRSVFEQSAIGAIYTRRASVSGDSAAVRMPEGHTAGLDLDLFTSHFRGNRNLQFETFLVWHTDPFGDATTSFGDRSTRGLRIAYPNDVWSMSLSAREVGDRYNPSLGLVTRRGFRRAQPTIGFSPRPERWERVRQLEFRLQMTHLTNLDGRLESFNNSWTLLGVRLASGDRFDLKAGRNFERLNAPFRIFGQATPDPSDDIVIPAGEFTTWSWEVSGRSAGQRTASVFTALEGGQFWSGRRLRSQSSLTVRPVAGVNIGTEYERNDVRLAEGHFVTNLARVSGGWHLSPWASLTSNVQYDDVSKVVGTFTRFRWIVRPGNDVFIVYTHNLRDDPTSLDRFRSLETVGQKAATKVSFTHRF